MKDSNVRSNVVERTVRFVETQSLINQILLFAAVLLALITLFLAVGRISARYSSVVPSHGGTIEEGVVGFPRVINPIYAENDAERSMSALVYSGLMKVSADGSIVPDLAESVTVENDGRVYIATLRDDVVFHDGNPVTAEDVVFTISEIQNPANQSPLAADWVGVDVKLVDAQTIRFTLESPYAFFLENLTTGIVPKHLWGTAGRGTVEFLELGSLPVGTGPFEVANIERNQDLGVAEMYTLTAFDDFVGGEPYVETLEMHFFESEDALFNALKEGAIDSAPVSFPTVFSEDESSRFTIETAPMLRSFGLFFNQSENELFIDTDVRRALALSVDKEALVENVFSGYAEPLTGPLPSHFLKEAGIEVDTLSFNPERARTLLAEAGFERNSAGVLENEDGETLSFTISTVAIPELLNTAEFLEMSFEALGASVEINAYDIGVLSRDVIRPRDYETLLFGLAYNRGLDLHPFFHSSNTADPGLNVALYTNPDVDETLEELQAETEPQARAELIESALTEMQSEQAALFLYSPTFTYATNQELKGVELPPIIQPKERFSAAANWFVYTERIFNIFKDNIRN